ncbi:MAG: rRNA maturation RNase YbeY [Patescibacteria group bacterium]
MRAVIESFDRRFNYLKPKIRRTIIKAAKFLKARDGYVEISLVNDKIMKKNVLAFPVPKNFPRPETGNKALGEVYLNPSYIQKKGESVSYMAIHGFLHLLGYDHKKKNDRMKMEQKERILFQKLRIVY